MKVLSATLALALIAGAAITTAQAPVSSKPGAPLVTVGCINRGQQSGSLASTPGAPPATPETAPVLANSGEPTNWFVLAGAKTPGSEETGAASDKPKPPLMTYRLDGDVREFEKHNGHRVEVTGHVVTPATPEKAETKSNISVLRVQSMKMIAREC
jgi:hypothetical protein